jgi:acid stress-induced BolA-like protein IbaG/YrbA
MQLDDVQAALAAAFPNSQIDARFEGNHLHLRVVSAEFVGLSAVKKQQRVYSVLQAAIASGAIHAVHMQTLTPDEFAAQA